MGRQPEVVSDGVLGSMRPSEVRRRIGHFSDGW
jgi:hypothetical protein